MNWEAPESVFTIGHEGANNEIPSITFHASEDFAVHVNLGGRGGVRFLPQGG
jgi:hypothetical protein